MFALKNIVKFERIVFANKYGYLPQLETSVSNWKKVKSTHFHDVNGVGRNWLAFNSQQYDSVKNSTLIEPYEVGTASIETKYLLKLFFELEGSVWDDVVLFNTKNLPNVMHIESIFFSEIGITTKIKGECDTFIFKINKRKMLDFLEKESNIGYKTTLPLSVLYNQSVKTR